MITKIANNDTFGAFTLIFLPRNENIYKFKSLKTQGLPSKNIEICCNIRYINWYLTPNKLFIIGFSSPNKENIISRGFEILITLNKVTLTNYPIFSNTRAIWISSHINKKQTEMYALNKDVLMFLKSYFGKNIWQLTLKI